VKTEPPKFRRWILAELPRLESAGLLDSDTRSRLENHYRQDLPPTYNRIMVVVGILASSLIGLGTILIFAHNWSELSRPLRAILALTPLILAAGAGVWVIRKGGHAWSEAASLGQALGVGIAISLIGQTYHIPSNTTAFFLSWALLILPLIFLLRSQTVHLVYLTLVVSWGIAVRAEDGATAPLWLLLLPAVFWTARAIRNHPSKPGTLVAQWGLVLALNLSIFARSSPSFIGMTLALIASLNGCLLLVGHRLTPDASGWSNPPSSMGLIALTSLAYLFSWSDFWTVVSRLSWVRFEAPSYPWGELVVLLALMTIWGLLAAAAARKKPRPNLVIIGLPLLLIVLILGVILGGASHLLAALIINLALLAVASATIWRGFRNLRLSDANYGLALFTIVVLSRFFDADFSFLARGSAFILIGGGFLAMNLWFARLKRDQQIRSI